MKTMTEKEFDDAFNLALKGIGNDFVNELVRIAPVDTGNLRNRINYTVNGNKINITMPKYAFYVEFGTKPHDITPQTKKALHWKVGKKDVFAKKVRHPGTEPYPFIRTVINTKLRDIVYQNLKRQLT